MRLDRRHFLVLLPAAAVAWKAVLAGTPEEASNYKLSEHWWGMLIDIPKCIGCGNCVRACAAENDVPEGNFRTWVERYHVTDENMMSPEVISPDGGKGRRWQVLFRTQALQPLRGLAVHAGVPGGRDLRHARRRSAGGSEVLPGMRVLRAGLPVRLPLYPSGKEGGRQVHALLPPDHQGPDHGMLRELPDGRAATGGFEESQRSHSRIPEDPQRADSEAADGYGRQGLLQRPGWIGEMKQGSGIRGQGSGNRSTEML